MHTIDLERWEEFEEQLRTREISTGGQHLFRGQGKSCWSLDTTLERAEQRGIPFAEYYRLISVARPQIETFTETNWGTLPEYDKVAEWAQEYDKFSLMLSGIGGMFPAYSYMAYLRHHGFPSPLLDWTRTPYVAAYFAFRNAAKERVAIYVYLERPGGSKLWSSEQTQIHTLGPYIRTHRRHFLQQSTYSICLDFQNGRGWNFAPHENVFARNDDRQDILLKFTIPSIERVKVLRKLDSYNLNAFSLFDSAEALMETMGIRQIDFKR
jgi:hypothetical protein